MGIETDSTINLNETQEKQDRNDYITSVGGFMGNALQLMQQAPASIPVVGNMLLFLSRGFKAGRELEGSLEQFISQTMQQAQQAQSQPPPPDPKAQEAQAKMQMAQQDQQAKQQQAQQDFQLEQQKAVWAKQLAEMQASFKAETERMKAESAVEAAKQKAEMQAFMEIYKTDKKHQTEVVKMQMAPAPPSPI